MDIMTVVWYLSTFLALAAFFFLMACSDRKCGRNTRLSNEQVLQAPPTPTPSYSEFAPPSYETVMKQITDYNHHQHIYVIPIHKTTSTLQKQFSTSSLRTFEKYIQPITSNLSSNAIRTTIPTTTTVPITPINTNVTSSGVTTLGTTAIPCNIPATYPIINNEIHKYAR